MPLRNIGPDRDELNGLKARFGIAQDQTQATDDELVDRDIALGYQRQVRELIYDAASAIVQTSEPSREQSVALTKLEEALMWYGKAVFK